MRARAAAVGARAPVRLARDEVLAVQDEAHDQAAQPLRARHVSAVNAAKEAHVVVVVVVV
jgi:hypothetical protein